MKKIIPIALLLSISFLGCENKEKQIVPIQAIVTEDTSTLASAVSNGPVATGQGQTTVSIPGTGSNSSNLTEVQPGANVSVNPNNNNPFNYETTTTIPVNMEVVDNQGNPVNPAIVTITNPNDNSVLLQQSTTPNGSVTASITVPTTTAQVEITVTIGGSTCQPVIVPVVVPINTNGTVVNQPISSIGNITLPISNPSGNATQIADKDGDGVSDKNDFYPEDPTRATRVRFPAKGVNTIAFEDLYPKTGDADLNDYVLQFYTEEDLNANGQIVEIRGAYQHVARGAGYRHTLNLKLLGDRNVKCKSDRGHGNNLSGVDSDNPGNSTGMNANGVNNRNENSQNNKEEDCNSSLASYGLSFESTITDSFGVNQNTGIAKFTPTESEIEEGLPILGNSGSTISSSNVQFNHSYSPGHIAKIKISFVKPISRSVLGASPYNIFLNVINTKKKIFFPGKYFDSKGNDLYMDSNGFPWAIMVPGVWAWPLESKDIRNASTTGYPRFTAWASSKGRTDRDWYTTVTSGKVYPLPSEPSNLLAYLKAGTSSINAIMAIALIILGISIGLIIRKKLSPIKTSRI